MMKLNTEISDEDMKQYLAEVYINAELIPLIKRSSQESWIIIASNVLEKLTMDSLLKLNELQLSKEENK